MEDTLGHYTLKTTFYDADYNLVAAPKKPGRYGVVAEVVSDHHGVYKRYITLYRQPKSFSWRDTRSTLTGELPPEIGVDRGILKERARDFNELLVDDWNIGLVWNADSAPLLAGLSEARPGEGSARWNNAFHRNDEWWYGLKKKIGVAKPVRYLTDLPPDYDADKAKRWPVLIFLHGSGERGDDLQVLRKHGPPKLVAQGCKFPFILISPQAPVGSYLIGAQLIELLDEVSAKYRVDPDRVYMTGLSMGGNSTWYTALEYPERFAAIAPIAAGGDPEGAARLKNLPTWYFIGGKDTNITPGGPEQMVEAMKAADVPYKYTFYPEATHGETWTQAYDDPGFYEWILAQKRIH
ncbi:hypothetical protein EON80_17490 [bacterium]|nr:MAG: hypothetical protein EON80_17490 [bacterium]